MKTFDYKDLELILAHNENGLYKAARLCFDVADKTNGYRHNQAVWVEGMQDLDKVKEFFLQDNIEVINIRPNFSNTMFAGYLVKVGV